MVTVDKQTRIFYINIYKGQEPRKVLHEKEICSSKNMKDTPTVQSHIRVLRYFVVCDN